jgi:hypothetical protein
MADERGPIIQACDDERLLGLKLWPKQRELLGTVDKGPILHVWCIGRDSGKSTAMAAAGVVDCLVKDKQLRKYLRPNEKRFVMAVAPTLDQARIVVQKARELVEDSPLFSKMIVSQSADEILFSNNSVFRGIACSSRTGRGWRVSTLIFDEFAHFLTETDGPQVADKVFNALMPSTFRFRDDARIIVSSTPWGEDNLFAILFHKAQTGELTDAVAFHATTREANPDISDERLANEEIRDPDSFKSEYLAQFEGSGAAFLDGEKIDDAVVERDFIPPEMGTNWIAGLDPAFSSDPFGLALVGRDLKDPTRLTLGLVKSWKPSKQKPGSFEERRELEDTVLSEVARVCLAYNARIVTDQYQAAAVTDFLRKRGLGVSTIPMTSQTKTATFTALRARLNLRGIELYADHELVRELKRLRSKYRSGAASVENPRIGGSHGDKAQALALATYEHDRWGLRGGESSWRQTPDLGFGDDPEASVDYKSSLAGFVDTKF